MKRHIEILPAKKYYGDHAIGYVVLVNGDPHHRTAKEAKQLYERLINESKISSRHRGD